MFRLFIQNEIKICIGFLISLVMVITRNEYISIYSPREGREIQTISPTSVPFTEYLNKLK